MQKIRAGEEIKFGGLGKSIRLQTHSNSIRCETDDFGESKYVATRSGYMHCSSSQVNMTRNGKSESKKKRDKMQIDILPYQSNKYCPVEDDTVIGIVMSGNPEFFQIDVGSD